MTPPLLNMLDNKLLQERYIKYVEKHIELCEKEVKRTVYDQRLNNLSKYYLDRYSNDLHVFKDVYNCNLIIYSNLFFTIFHLPICIHFGLLS